MQEKNKILVVDDSEINREILANILKKEYQIMTAESGETAISMLKKYDMEISLVLLDILMPDMDGFEVLSLMSQNNWLQRIPVIMISSETDSDIVSQAYDIGAVDYITRPFHAKIVLRRIRNIISLYTKQKDLESLAAEKIMEKEKSSREMIDILSNIVDFRNGESRLHIAHVRALTNIFLQELKKLAPQYNLTNSKISHIITASVLHDMGKVSISDDIRNESGQLGSRELKMIQKHSFSGADILKASPAFKDSPLLQTAYEICKWRHERYDGSGYPDGLKGDEIPISAQVVALADLYDTLTNEGIYKPAYPHDQAMQMILNGKFGVFNPILLDCLQSVYYVLEHEVDLLVPDNSMEINISEISSEIMAYQELPSSRRTLSLLEQEKNKFQFFASLSQEIMFDYDLKMNILEVSDYASRYLEINKTIQNPLESKNAPLWLRKTMLNVKKQLEHVTISNPVISYHEKLVLPNKEQTYKFYLKALWDEETDLSFSRIIGKLIEADQN